VAAAEAAAGESPTDRELADALRGAATTHAFAGSLAPSVATLLCVPSEPAAQFYLNDLDGRAFAPCTGSMSIC
jgi:hypothetical protein